MERALQVGVQTLLTRNMTSVGGYFSVQGYGTVSAFHTLESGVGLENVGVIASHKLLTVITVTQTGRQRAEEDSAALRRADGERQGMAAQLASLHKQARIGRYAFLVGLW